ncbi:MAG: BglG family transcription antiterminator [Fusobacteriaceae bacterium]
MLPIRFIDILTFILKNNNEITLKNIANAVHLTQKNVRMELEKLNEYLSLNHYKKIEIEKDVLKYFDLNEILMLLEDNNNFSPTSEEREIYIILIILLNREINQRKISEELNIGKTTVKGHLKDVKKFLIRYNLTLEIQHKKGLQLVGKEENIRENLLKILNIISNKNSLYLKNKIEKLVLNTINGEGIKKFINYCQKLMKIIISDEAYDIIFKYLKISLYMSKRSYIIESIKNEIFLSQTKEYKAVKKSSPILEEWYEIELSRFEYLKITDYFLGSNTYNLNYSYYDNWVEMEIIIKELILEFNKEIKEDISQDKLLLEGLLNHIKPTIYRIKNNIILENSIYKEVIESYPSLFKIVKNIIKKLENSMNIKFTEDEIAFLVIHFKAAMDRNIIKNEKIKILLVCSSGYGTSNLLAQKIKQYYNVIIIDIIPKYLIESILRKEKIDIILSTVDIEKSITSKPIIKLNSILSEEDKRKIESYGILKNNKKISMDSLVQVIKRNSNELNEKKLKKELKELLDEFLVDDIIHKKNTIFDYLNNQRILLNETAKDWKEAIEKIGSLLIKENIIEQEYIEDSIKIIEEFGSYIILAPQVAFPHARTTGKVKETGFSIITLNKPVLFPSGELVSIFVLFSSKDNKEHLEFFMNLVDLFNKEGILDKIKKVKKISEMINILKKELPN